MSHRRVVDVNEVIRGIRPTDYVVALLDEPGQQYRSCDTYVMDDNMGFKIQESTTQGYG